MTRGDRMAYHYSAEDARRMGKTFEVLVKQTGIVIVDGEFGDDGSFPLPVMDSSEIVVQVSTSAATMASLAST